MKLRNQCGKVGGVSNVMIVHPKNPARSPRDVVDAAKRKPGELTFSSGGSGTSHHMSGVLFAQMTGTQLLHVRTSRPENVDRHRRIWDAVGAALG